MAMNPRLLRPTPTGFDPRRIPGLILWSDASDQSRAFSDDASTTAAANDSGVAVLQSKVGPSLTQNIEANRPTYKTSLLAGKAGLQFDGINDSMAFASPITQAVGQHIFAAVDTTSLGLNYRLFLQRTAGTGTNLALYLGRNSPFNRQPAVFWSGDKASHPTAVQRPAVIRWHYDTGLTAVQVDGGAETTAAGATDLTSWSTVTDSSVQQSAFNLFELLIYSSLTAAQVAVVNNYLLKRWSI